MTDANTAVQNGDVRALPSEKVGFFSSPRLAERIGLMATAVVVTFALVVSIPNF